MDLELTAALPSLRDVDGVAASFVLSDDGDVIARDAPAYLDDSALREAAPRLSRFHEAMSSTGDYLDFFVLEFGDQALHTRRVPNGFLCMLTSSSINAAALRMAVNLMARKVGDRIAQQRMLQAAPPAMPAPPPAMGMRPSPPPLPQSSTTLGRMPHTTPPPLPRSTPTALPAETRQSSTRPVTTTPSPMANPPSRPLRVYRGAVQK